MFNLVKSPLPGSSWVLLPHFITLMMSQCKFRFTFMSHLAPSLYGCLTYFCDTRGEQRGKSTWFYKDRFLNGCLKQKSMSGKSKYIYFENKGFHDNHVLNWWQFNIGYVGSFLKVLHFAEIFYFLHISMNLWDLAQDKIALLLHGC